MKRRIIRSILTSRQKKKYKNCRRQPARIVRSEKLESRQLLSAEPAVNFADRPPGIAGNDHMASVDDNREAVPPFGRAIGADASAGRGGNARFVEPLLQLHKQSGNGKADADQQITVTLDVSHHHLSNADAFEVNLLDSIAPGLSYVADSLRWTGVGKAPNSIELDGDNILADWDGFQLADISQLQYDVVVGRGPAPGSTLTSSAAAIWTSLPGESGLMPPHNIVALERRADPFKNWRDDNHYVTSVTGDLAVNSTSLGGMVYLDANADGSFTEEETGICHVRISIEGTNHIGERIQRSELTDCNGDYRFPSLRPGIYTITETHPESYFDGIESAGSLGGGIGSDVVEGIVVPLQTDGEIGGYNFGEFPSAAILGTVYVDDNNDGTLDPTEQGISDVQVTLTGTDALGNYVERTQSTARDGTYLFQNLRGGSYSLHQIQPVAYFDGKEQLGDQYGVAEEDRFEAITLAYGAQARDYNFGELEPSTLRGSVYVDLDRDGVFDAEDVSIVNVEVTLTGSDDRGNTINNTVRTDLRGQYDFAGLRPGTYNITSTAVPEFADGTQNIGRFANERQPIEENGTIGDNEFLEIELGPGRLGERYSFGKLDDDYFQGILADSYSKVVVFGGTEQADVFEFTAGHTEHLVRINGEEFSVEGGESVSVQFFGGAGDDHVLAIGTDHTEQAELRSKSGKVLGTNYELRGYSTTSFSVRGNGGEDRAYLYDTQGDDQLHATTNVTTLSGVDYQNQVESFHRVYSYATDGLDTATMFDSPGDDSFLATAHDARMYGPGFYFYTRNFDTVHGIANHGGNDSARLWDSEGDDVLLSTATESTLSGNGYSLQATGFGLVRAYADAGGSDEAYLHDSSGDDRFYGYPTESRLVRDQIEIRAAQFDQVYARASEGNDRAYLYDSHEDDFFTASPTEASMAGEAFDINALTFDRVYAYATRGGDDWATLSDSPGDDVFEANPTDARMYGSGFYNFTSGFRHVQASSTVGNDRAYLYDSAGNDHLIATPDRVQLLGAMFDNQAHGFARSYAYAHHGGHDQATFYDSSSADTLNVDVDGARMYGRDYYNFTNGFDCVDAFFTAFNESDDAWFDGLKLFDFDADVAVISLQQSRFSVHRSAASGASRDLIELVANLGEWNVLEEA